MTTSDELTGRSRKIRGLLPPAECQEFVLFWDGLRADATVSDTAMLTMFRDLGVYGHLTELGTIALNLRQILDLVMDRAGWEYSDLMMDWPPLVDWILRHPSLLPQPKYTRGTADKNPLVYLCATSHPLYTLLWTDTDPNQLEELRLLQAHALIAHLIQVRMHDDHHYDYLAAKKAPYAEVIANTYRMSVAIREISQISSPIRPEDLRPDRPPEQFAEQMYLVSQELQKKTAKKKQSSDSATGEGDVESLDDSDGLPDLFRQASMPTRTHLQGLSYALAETYALRSRGHRSRTKGRARDRRTIHGYLPLLELANADQSKANDDDPARRSEAVRRVVEAAVSFRHDGRGARKYQEEFDIDEAENYGQEMLEVEIGCALTQGGYPALHTLALRGKVQAEAVQNQLFPWDYDLLTDTAVKNLLNTMQETFEQELQRTTLSMTARLVALLGVILWTGCSLDVARKLRIIPAGEERWGGGMLVLEHCSATGGAFWNLQVSPPSYAQSVASSHEASVDIQESVLRFPDVAGGSRYFLQLRERYPEWDCTFPRPEKLQKPLRRYLKMVDPSGYLTISKIEDYLWRHLVLHGDLAEADLLVGKRHYLSQVRRYYTALPVAVLERRYVAVVEQLQRDIGLQKVAETDLVSPASKYVGAAYRPTLVAVQRAVHTLQDRLQESEGEWESKGLASDRVKLQLWQKYYNLYTVYTWFYFAYATAARATCNTLPHDPSFPLHEGFIAYSDKTTADQSHVRLVWLPEALARQLAMQRLLAEESWDIRARNTRVERTNGNFLLIAKSAQPLCPKILQAQFADLFGAFLPANSHRRFCRSHLLEEGCPAEVVDAFMGHWFAGESSWSRYSSQSALTYLQELQPYLLRMLDALQFRYIPLGLRKLSHGQER
ncbi:MAG: hypothetical protein PHO57_06375 [Acidithiobacillus sp.]|nr:hypothetical protein [Acidithiobacillus sp.]